MGKESWGPEARRAAISVSFQTLAGSGRDEPVTPALPTLLRALADRDLRATFFVEAELAESEPFAFTMIGLGGHELGCLSPGASMEAARTTLEAFQKSIAGVRPPADASAPDGDAIAGAGFLYSSPAGTEAASSGRVPYDPALVDSRFLHPEGGGAPALHNALQIAVGRALEHGDHLCLVFHPGLLERRATLGVAVEVLDLVAGLEKAGRAWVAPLVDVAGSLS